MPMVDGIVRWFGILQMASSFSKPSSFFVVLPLILKTQYHHSHIPMDSNTVFLCIPPFTRSLVACSQIQRLFASTDVLG